MENFGGIIVNGMSFLKEVENIVKGMWNHIPPNLLYRRYILMVEILGERE